MKTERTKAFFISIPHSGEQIPDEVRWLQNLPEKTLMQDVDRYVDQLYAPVIQSLHLPSVVTQWHRYVVDLNRIPTDVDVDSVENVPNRSGSFTTGLHWSKTTRGEVLMPKPITQELHKSLVENYFQPFHKAVQAEFAKFKNEGHVKVFHLDAHSMPSMGTAAHRDPGQLRPEIVVSDFDGQSCETRFKDTVMQAYASAGFQVAYNWPYKGGRVTQTYGQPDLGQHTLQVELRRSLYMDEETKKPLPDAFLKTQEMIEKAVRQILHDL